MRRASQLLMAVVALGLAAATCLAAPILDSVRITEETWPNGFRLIMKPETGWGLVSAQLVIRAGSAYETEDQVGAAHLLEHLLFEASDLRDEQRVGPAIESLGGYVNALTTRDSSQIDITVASQYLDQTLPLLARAVFQPQLSAVSVAREREVVARELTDRLDAAGGALDDLLWHTAFSTHPYRRPIGGTPEQVATLTVDDLVAYYARYYVPGNMALVVVGDVDPAAVRTRVGELFGAQTGATPNPPQIAHEPQPADVRIAVATRPSQSTVVSFGWLAPEVESFNEVCAMDLIYTVLGQGQFGRLYQALNERGLALMTDVGFLTQRDSGLLAITALTSPELEADARAAILAEVDRLRTEPLTEEQLSEAKRILRIEYAFNNEAYSDQAGSLGFYENLGDYRLAVDYIDRINAVTPALLQQVATRYLDPKTYALAIIRPQAPPGTTEEARATCELPSVQG